MIGIDYGSVDGNASIDFKRVRNQGGAGFAIIRKYQRLVTKQLRDDNYARDAKAARAAGLVAGAYLFPSFNKRAPGAEQQVAEFKATPGDIVRGVDFPPTLDVEFPGGLASTGRSKAEAVDFLHEFVVSMYQAFGCWPMIYTSFNQWNDLGLPSAPWIAECPLWIKTAYWLPSKQPIQTTPVHEPHVGYDKKTDPKNFHRVPDSWTNSGWWVQQYQGDAIDFPGMPRTVDINRFNITHVGDSGPHVKWLQRRLKLKTASIDGVFGADTDSAVRSFQAANELPVDGVVGPRTFVRIAWTQ